MTHQSDPVKPSHSVTVAGPARGARRMLAAATLTIMAATLPATIASSTALAKDGSPTGAAQTRQDRDATFGAKLAEAAREQISWLVLYDPSYRKIAYPGGDVPWYIGVCTDVIVRAYRKLDIDLQERVHKARVGSGDTNIDHRRVPVLKRFFARHGQSLAITKTPEDYRPGDIVTYHLPDGRYSKTHIGIVSSQTSSEGVPLLVHNRGFGVHEEDWLFAQPITGHYRFTGR